MIELLIYSVAAFGFAYVVGHAVISRPARLWLAGEAGVVDGYDNFVPVIFWRRWIVTLVECPACLGWWTGAIVGAVVDGFGGIIIGAFYTAGSNYVLSKITRLID